MSDIPMKMTDVDVEIGDIVCMVALGNGCPEMVLIQMWADAITHEAWAKCYWLNATGEVQDRDFPFKVLRWVRRP